VPRRDVIVMGASAGGVEALMTLVPKLPADLPAAVLLVVHTPPTGTNALSRILDRAGPLPARSAGHAEPLRRGEILVAPADHHLLVIDNRVALSRGPRENGHRPAIDTLFRSASAALGPRVVSVVLSGVLDDGAAGSIAVRARGGVVLAQDPGDAIYTSMPLAAIAVAGAEPVELAALPARLEELLAEEIDLDDAPPPSDLLRKETAVAEMEPDAIESLDRPGTPSGFSCPDCHGVLFEIEEGGLRRFRCRVGHAWSPDSLIAEHDLALEGALWMALRTLEEKAALSAQLSGRAEANGQALTAERFAVQSHEVRDAAELIRRLLESALGRDDDPAVPATRPDRSVEGDRV
jgi:two-component system, chemotaxis family, protein-glutamate methylesterase/glutaminase